MASPTSTDTIRGRLFTDVFDHDPGSTSALVTTPDGGTTQRWLDMRDYTDFQVIVITTVLGGSGPNLVEIVAADDTSGTNATQIKTSGAVVMDALADAYVLTCTAAEIRQESEDAGYTLRYAAARITCDNAGDEAIVIYQGVPRHPQLNLTAADQIS